MTSAACTCSPAIKAANKRPKDGRYIGHEASCPLHWDYEDAEVCEDWHTAMEILDA
jgi:hypothetical protein